MDRPPSELYVQPSVRALLALLLGHYRCAEALGCPAEGFPVADSLVRCTGVARPCLEALEAHGFLTRLPKSASGRAGIGARPRRHAAGVVLTARGAAWLLRDGLDGGTWPHWDAGRRELHFGGEVVLRFRRQAPSQWPVLGWFEEAGWPPRLPVPRAHSGAAARERLRQTLNSLNRGQCPPRLHFQFDDSGRAVAWVSRP
jgi:hypothetical protein